MSARAAISAYLVRAARARSARLAALRATETLLLSGALLAAGLILLRFFPVTRPWVLLALGCIIAVGLGLTLAARLRPRSEMATARWIARRQPAFGTALADAVEFDDRLRAGAPLAGSPELAAAHVEAAAARASESPERHAREAIPAPPLASAALAWVAAACLLAALPAARRALLEGPPARPEDAIAYGDVEITYRYPAYLRRPERVETGTGDVVAPVGTHVTLLVTADRPLRAARLQTPEGPVEMSIEGARATGRLVVTRDGAWTALLEGADGVSDDAPPEHAIRAEPDAPPQIRLVSPPGDTVTLGPREGLDLLWSATDDHGLAEIVEVVALASAQDASAQAGPAEAPAGPAEGIDRARIESLDPPMTQRSGRRLLTPADLGLEPGRDVVVWIEARDDDEVSGPKWAASRRITVTLGQDEAAGQQAEDLSAVVAEQLLATLAGHLVARTGPGTPARELLDHDARFTAGVRQALQALDAALPGLQEAREDLAATTALEEMRGRLDWMVRARARRIGEAGADAAALRAAAATLHPPEVEELERDVLFFDMWADRRASLRAVDSAEALLEAVERLQDALASAAPEELAAEQGAASRALSAVSAQVDDLRPQVEELAGAATESERARQAREALAALAAAVRRQGGAHARGDLPGARELAAAMEREATELADLVDELGRAGQVGDAELAAEMMRAEAEIRRLKRQQSDLRDRTNALREELEGGLSQDDRAAIDELFLELIALAEQAVSAESDGERRLADTPSVARAFSRIEAREQAESRLEDLEELARAGEATDQELEERERLRRERREEAREERFEDLESLMRLSQASRESLGRLRQVLADRQVQAARTPARWSLGALDLLLDEMGRQGDDVVAARPPFQTAAARAAEILSRLDELERQIDRATSSRMTQAQRQQMDSAAGAQAGLLQLSRDLAARLRELGADAPFLDEQVGQALEQAGEQMDDAASRLHGRRPGDASEAQGEAMARLDEAAKALAPSGSSRDGSRAGPERPGQRGQGSRGRDSRRGRFSRDAVKIPDAEDYRVPKEFREEILAAMRSSSAPPGYEEHVREYYRRLVE